jgi:hypothetical protein
MYISEIQSGEKLVSLDLNRESSISFLISLFTNNYKILNTWNFIIERKK